MQTYQPPLREVQFIVHELLGVEKFYQDLVGFEDLNRDLIDPILNAAAKISADKVFPLNMKGDQEGCRFLDGKVTVPTGFREAYMGLVEDGWYGLPFSEEYGGQNLPMVLGACIDEFLASANLSLSTYAALTKGAVVALEAHANKHLKQQFLPKLVTGEWAGVMCLTEAHAGTDIGILKTRAMPCDDDSYLINGSKIFISGGEQDLTDNIVHLVLARLPGAPAGPRGISLLVVPKFIPKSDGSLGERNGVHCISIEEKMGLHGSATCSMNYEDARGWLVGEEHRGLDCMFTMMNHMRLLVGQEGLSVGEVAYQSAAAYALERRQGRALNGVQDPNQVADLLVVHPDVRRLLLTARSLNETNRALVLWTWQLTDASKHHVDSKKREQFSRLVEVLTPVVKAFITDSGFQTTVDAQQIFGGHGYIRDVGIDQLVRDARILMIYEGANGIQSLDLVARKLIGDNGKSFGELISLMKDFCSSCDSNDQIQPFVKPLDKAINLLEETARHIIDRSQHDANEIGASSHSFLRFTGLTLGAYLGVKMAKIALDNMDGSEADFYRTKLITVRFYLSHMLPETNSLVQVIKAGSDQLMAMDANKF